MVVNPYSDKAFFDFEKFRKTVDIGIEYLDQVIDIAWKRYPLKEQQETAQKWRNCGLGVMGYATMLMKLGITYGSDKALELTDDIFNHMFVKAVCTSGKLAKEKGKFPSYDEKIFDSTIIKNHFNTLEIQELKKYGLRNCSLLSIAPTGLNIGSV